MNCQETKKLIPVYLDDELEAAERQQVANHLQACADCRTEARAIEKSWGLLGAIKAIEPDPNYRARFWRSVESRIPWHARILQVVQTFFLQRRWVPVTAGAAMVLLVSIITIDQYRQKPKVPADLAALNDTELEMVADIELAEDYDIIEDMDFFSDFDIIQNMNELEAS